MTAVIKTVWEYEVSKSSLDDFLRAYEPNGDWAQLFLKCEGYLRTELHRDTKNEFRFLTIDYWQSLELLNSMKQSIEIEYRLLDKICEDYTLSENHIGIFEEIA